jgi:hypothetical protein
VIADDDGGAKPAHVRIDRKFRAGRQKAHPEKKTFQMDVIHLLQNSVDFL